MGELKGGVMDSVDFVRKLLDHMEEKLIHGTPGSYEENVGYTMALNDITAWIIKDQTEDIKRKVEAIRGKTC